LLLQISLNVLIGTAAKAERKAVDEAEESAENILCVCAVLVLKKKVVIQLVLID